MGRTIIVGDVHGCREELEELLAKIGFRYGDDQLFLVGDLIARGPDSQGVVAFARQQATVTLRGNHEDKILRWYAARHEGKPEESLSEIHRRVARDLLDEDWAFLARTPLWHDLPDHDIRIIHAGLVPGLAIEKQEAKTLLTVRSISAEGEPLSRPASVGWASLYVGSPHIVFGHHAQREPQLQPYATGIDTGCVYGGYLTAAVLHPGERMPSISERRHVLVSFPAKRRYFGKPSAERR